MQALKKEEKKEKFSFFLSFFKEIRHFPAVFAFPSSSRLFFAKKEKKKQKPSSSFPSSLMGKYHGSQRCFLCNVDENPLRHTPQQYTGPELSSLAHHEDRKACRSCLAFTLKHIKVGNIALSPFFPLFSV